jgi:TolB-like protein/AraC-like DNA-binding protein/tetratricopeptide (TPR) repeat protein
MENRKSTGALNDRKIFDSDHPFLRKVTAVVENNLKNEQFGAGELVSEMNMNRYTLYRKLKTLTGKSISRFIREIRLQKSMDLLREEDKNASEIAYEVGFNSPAYFTRCFHKYFGFPPGEVKKRIDGSLIEIVEGNNESAGSNGGKADKKTFINHIHIILFSVFAILVSSFFIYKQVEANRSENVRSLVVLPLENLSGDPDQESFAAGMHEALINELGKISEFRVISRTSSMRYQDTKKSIAEIAEELSVDAIVEASVFPVDDSVRINVQLIRAVPEEHQIGTWSYDRHMRNILALQGDVVCDITDQVNLKISGEKRLCARHNPDIIPEAYALYLKGNIELEKRNEAAFLKAREYFQQAIEIDSGYAPSFAGLATSLIHLQTWISSFTPGKFREQARKAINKALELDPQLADAHIASGRIKHLFDWDWAGAEKSFSQGIDLNPNSTNARIVYQNYLISMGRFSEAIEVGRKTLQLDPLSPLAYIELAWAFEFSGNLLKAEKLYFDAMDMDPHMYLTYVRLAGLYEKTGKINKAFKYAKRAEELLGESGPQTYVEHIGFIYARINRRKDAMRMLDQLLTRSKTEYISPIIVGTLYIGLGEIEKALNYYDTGFKERDVVCVWMKVHWHMDPLRDEPRFQALIEKMNFPEHVL